MSYFGETFTPNDAFFVRYRLMDIPETDAAAGTSRSVRLGRNADQFFYG